VRPPTNELIKKAEFLNKLSNHDKPTYHRRITDKSLDDRSPPPAVASYGSTKHSCASPLVMDAKISGLEDRLSEFIDDPEFGDIERWFGRFNLFEAMGAPRRELEHSNFLAFLLSPSGARHRTAAPCAAQHNRDASRAKRPVRPLDVALGDLDDAIIYRERDNIIVHRRSCAL
jgi:hypothetical protein